MSFDTAPDQDSPVDHGSGLPRLGIALADIQFLAREQHVGYELGVISLFVPATPALYRLTPEAAQDLRQGITRELGTLLRPKDRLYSLSRWEWLVVLPDLVSSAPLTLACLKLSTAFNRTVPLRDGSFPLRALCGAALRTPGEDALHLVQSARIARLKAEGEEASFTLYRPDMEEADAALHRLHQLLEPALHGNDIDLDTYLQPQVDLSNGHCVGAELLLRWKPEPGLSVPPPHAIAVVERFGLRNAFNRWLFQRAMQALDGLAQAGIAIPLSVNLSASDLLNPELPDLVAQVLATWEIAPNRLVLEITESAMIEETDSAMDVLTRLRQLGVHLSIDDFGTGYSSMSYLQRLPVQEVKIDQSFVCPSPDSPRDREIVASILQLAHRLGMSVVAEGVESEEIRKVVADLGCDRGQGFLYAPAMPLEEFIHWWRSR